MNPDLFRYPPYKLKDKINVIGKINIDAIKDWLMSKDQDIWSLNEIRQQTFSVHKDTQSIVLKWSKNSDTTSPVETSPLYSEFEPLILPILNIIQDHFKYEKPIIRKMMLAKLKKGGVISEHIDAAIALRMVHRIHIAITSNDDVHFYIDEEDFHFDVGSIIEFDNTRYHAVYNKGNEDRIHLIIDYYHE